MATPPVTKDEFKAKFDRAFKYGTGLETVRDSDIDNAFSEALLVFNPSLWDTANAKQAFLYASAHFVVVNIQAAGGALPVVTGEGLDNRSDGIVENKTVGQVSVAYTPPPDRLKRMAFLQPFWETEFGKRYVMMLLPKLVGNTGAVSGPVDLGAISTPVPFAGP